MSRSYLSSKITKNQMLSFCKNLGVFGRALKVFFMVIQKPFGIWHFSGIFLPISHGQPTTA